jgi:hypothetical protein
MPSSLRAAAAAAAAAAGLAAMQVAIAPVAAFPATLVPRQVVRELPATVRQMIGDGPDEEILQQLAQWQAEADSFSSDKSVSQLKEAKTLTETGPTRKVLFHVSDDAAIYQTTTFSYPDGSKDPAPFIAASLGDNGGPEAGLDVYDARNSTVIWNDSGKGYISASAEGVTASAICSVAATVAQCVVSASVTSTGTLLWTTVLFDVGATAIGVTPDGSVVTLAVTSALPPYPATTYHGQVYEWDATTGGILGVWNAGNATNVRAFVTTNTLFAAVVSEPKDAVVAVIDRATGTLLWKDTFDFSTSTLCFSRDGSVMGYGFESFDLFTKSKDGKSYDQVGTLNGPVADTFAAACSVQTTPSKSVPIHSLAIGWTAFSYTQVTVTLHNVTSPTTPLWTYAYPSDAGSTVQNLPSAMAASDDGQSFVVATWGGSAEVSPQIAVFGVKDPAPLFSVVTPGSMVTADIKSLNDGSLYTVAAGKHVHCNIMGDGGDMYSIQVQ